jgi:hypothetical protein
LIFIIFIQPAIVAMIPGKSDETIEKNWYYINKKRIKKWI